MAKGLSHQNHGAAASNQQKKFFDGFGRKGEGTVRSYTIHEICRDARKVSRGQLFS
jgi:hypothetical protein